MTMPYPGLFSSCLRIILSKVIDVIGPLLVCIGPLEHQAVFHSLISADAYRIMANRSRVLNRPLDMKMHMKIVLIGT